MHVLPLLVTTAALVHLYRYYNNDNHPNPYLHKLHKRLRVCLGMAIIGTLVTVSYLIPVEMGRAVLSVQDNQVALAAKRQEARQASEIKHVRQMVDALGGYDNYLTYLKRLSSQ